MSMVFTDHGNVITYDYQDTRKTSDHLPVGIYRLKMTESPFGISVSFERKEFKQFVVTERRYGRHDRIVKTIFDDYDRVNPPLGVIAIGEKGGGKSLLCEDLSNRLLSKGLPILMVDQAIPPEVLLEISNVSGPCVFYFDEIGKIYTDKNAGALLTFFSNQNQIGRVFLVTANAASELSPYFFERPGRFKYKIDMSKIERDAYLEYLTAQNVPSEKVIWLESIWRSMTYDQLRVIVPLLHRTDSIRVFMEDMNILNVCRPQLISFGVSTLRCKGANLNTSTGLSPEVEIVGDNFVMIHNEKTLNFRWRNPNGTLTFTGTNGGTIHEGDYELTVTLSTFPLPIGSDMLDRCVENTPVFRSVYTGSDITSVPADETPTPVTTTGLKRYEVTLDSSQPRPEAVSGILRAIDQMTIDRMTARTSVSGDAPDSRTVMFNWRGQVGGGIAQ